MHECVTLTTSLVESIRVGYVVKILLKHSIYYIKLLQCYPKLTNDINIDIKVNNGKCYLTNMNNTKTTVYS